jgi:CheY-like chemotaxis protein
MIEVSDTGEGMDEEVLSHVFEPFFTTKEIGKGTGLGLSTVYGIVKQSNGSIVPYSEPGKGTTFKILFPAVDSKNGEKEASVPITASELNSGECILLAEDEPALRAFARRILATAGYRVLTAGDGFHAMELASQQNQAIDLLITDMVMPGMSGKDLAQRLVQLRSNVKVLYVSGYSRDIVGQSEFASEAFAFLQKPFTAQTLLTKVHEVLGNVLTATVV